MQLKRLQLTGFKTFADKTEIDLAGGLTAVVGPNGCGKSNVADALLWVMGEQNPRLLRGNEARDVIFAGTGKRKPLGMAEVKLLIDNSEGDLPIQAAEISVARRVYRSGDSQYLINGAQCRMKDVVELFLDTGAGKGAYSFITQSEVDAVLSAKAEDRRELFEEAAGIKKYRVKKREATRKLDSAEANITRVRDILGELEQQRAPMEEQARKAKRYRELTNRLQQIEIDLLIAEAHQLDYELYAARQERELNGQSVREIDDKLTVLEREAASLGEQISVAEAALDTARLNHQSALRAFERTDSQLQLVEQRGHGAEESADSLAAEVTELSQRAAQFSAEASKLREKLATAQEREAAARASSKACAQTVKERDQAANEALRAAEEQRRTLLRMAEQRAHGEAALQACVQRIDETTQRLSDSTDRGDAAQTQYTTSIARTKAVEEQADQQRAAMEGLHSKRTQAEQDRRKLQDALAQHRLASEQASRLVAERSSRLSTLQELQEAGEGLYQGVKAVLAAARHGQVQGDFKPVVDLLEVPAELRVAIEVAMGGSLQDVVCADETQAKSAIAWLKERKAGRATFLPLTLLRPGQTVPASALKGLTGMMGVASDLVSAPKGYEAVLELLLGRVVVAKDVDAGIAASRKMNGWSRIVTLDGELLTPGGAMTGGSLQGKGAHLVGRKGEIDDLRKELPKLQSHQSEAEAAIVQQTTALETAVAAIRSVDEELSAAQAAAAATESDLQSARRDEERLATQLADARAEAKRLSDAIAQLQTEQTNWQTLLADRTEGADGGSEALQKEIDRLLAERDAAREAASKAELEAVRATEQRSSLEQGLRTAETSLKETTRSQEAKQAQRELAASTFREASVSAGDLRLNLEHARTHAQDCETHVTEGTARRQELVSRNFETSNQVRDLQHRRSQLTQELHDAELQIARQEIRLSQTGERLEEEYSITLEEALQREDPPTVSKETANEVARLRREVRQMGEVNTGAVEEYDRLTERHEFLNTQRADLEQARASLLATIAEIDDSTRGVFMETFDAVASEFQSLFTRLFGGGETKLSLTQPDNLLETGIEIIAQPPGKKPMSLSLLSGGERALTAVALIFSFLAVKPAPFVVLDEVDAPLDGTNVEKFAQLVAEFSQRSQFLVITHNPTTMEASPRWYGVTMSEAGVSRVMAYRVPEEATASEPEQAVVREKIPASGAAAGGA